MERRTLIRKLATTSAFVSCAGCRNHLVVDLFNEEEAEQPQELPGQLSLSHPEDYKYPNQTILNIPEVDPKKSEYFNTHFQEDIIVKDQEKLKVYKSLLAKLSRLQKFVGFGRFNILNFDDAITLSRRSLRLKRFSKEELSLIDELFHFDARQYGFFGHKVTTQLTDVIHESNVAKIPGSGHYLLLGQSFNRYQNIKSTIGDSLILTSGIRGVIKQTYLFLNKAAVSNWNLSMASRSLAPPGYSWHNAGDFDIGKQGLGLDNFTSEFSHTDEYKKLVDMGIAIRYPEGNDKGVRFEPWHIRMDT